jgi:hypothetical protein
MYTLCIYPLRNGSDLIIPFCSLSITTESFIPSTVKSQRQGKELENNPHPTYEFLILNMLSLYDSNRFRLGLSYGV